jgi:hypothetical protein
VVIEAAPARGLLGHRPNTSQILGQMPVKYWSNTGQMAESTAFPHCAEPREMWRSAPPRGRGGDAGIFAHALHGCAGPARLFAPLAPPLPLLSPFLDRHTLPSLSERGTEAASAPPSHPSHSLLKLAFPPRPKFEFINRGTEEAGP